MSKPMLSPVVQRYQVVMRVMGLVYLAGALLFLLAPELVLWLVNLPAVLPGVVGLEPASEHFWTPLAASMMAMLTALAFAAAASPENRVYPWVHNLSKLVSSLGYLFYFFRYNQEGWAFPYLLGFLVDFPIFLAIAWLTLRVAWAREPAPAPGTPPPPPQMEAKSGNEPRPEEDTPGGGA